MSQRTIRTYTELMQLPTFKERYEYLRIGGTVGEDTFGFDRYLNQQFYKSDEWQAIRNQVLLRDNGCDLGMPDREIGDNIIVHHMNPIAKEDILNKSEILLNPEYLICTAKNTHDAIHYGNDDLLYEDLIERSANDTCPWRH